MEFGQQTSPVLSQDYLDAILENFQDGIYITDSEANTVYLNHSYELISGLLKTEMLGKNMKNLVEEGVISMSGSLQVLETGKSTTLEQSFRTGKRAIITSTPIFDAKADSPHILMVVTIVREITEIYSIRKELQRLEQLNRRYVNENARLRGELSGETEIVAAAPSSAATLRLAERVSLLDDPILISGEHGVGKERLARLIHDHSARSGFSFMRLSFSVIPREDPVAYLFGRENPRDGSYEMGILESADGGTVYIENLTDIPPAAQGRFLSLLRDGACVMGDGSLRKLDIRLIAGSCDSFETLKKNRLVEEDILNCFSLFPIEIAPLRERRDDIIPLLDFFLAQHNKKTGENKYFSPECCRKLYAWNWPQNVRELSILTQRAAIVSTGDEIQISDLLPEIRTDAPAAAEPDSVIELADGSGAIDLKYETAKVEARYMIRALEKYGNVRDAAKSLGIDSSTFVRKRQRYEMAGLMQR